MLLHRCVRAALAVAFIWAASVVAQTGVPIPFVSVQFLDDAGRPLSDGKVYTCPAGQSCPGTLLATFKTSSLLVQNDNPVTLDAGGRAQIWLSPNVAYRFALTRANGQTVTCPNCDNIIGAAGSISGGGGGGGGGGGSTVPGGVTGNVQYNGGSNTFAGSSNFIWNNAARILTVIGNTGTPGIVSAGGFVQSAGGFLSSVPGGSWQGFNTNTDGALLRGLNVGQNQANTAGGYINLAPVTYNPNGGGPCTDEWGNPVQQPIPLNGLAAFGANSAVLWVSQSPSMPASGCGAEIPVNLNWGINTNTYFLARGGLATDQTSFNSIHSLKGGVTAVSFTAGRLYPTGTVTTTGTLSTPTYLGGYVQVGHSTTAPAAGTIATVTNPLTGNDGLIQGTLFYNDTSDCLQVANIALTFSCLGGGGGGSVAGANTQVQYNNSGAFGASANFTWTNATRLLTVTSSASTNPGIAVATGFMQADAGFLGTVGTCTNFNCFHAPDGGMGALSFTSVNYTQIGNYNDGTRIGVPPLTTADTAQAGRVYWDCGGAACSAGTGSAKIYNGTAFVTLATGGATSPGGANTNVQFNSSGSFGGTANLTYASQLLTSVASSSTVASILASVGFAQADKGFYATTGTCTSFNCFFAPTGGGNALSFTAVNYVQVGSFSSGGVGTLPTITGSDAIHPGLLSWDTFSSQLKVYNGTTMVALGTGGGGGSATGPLGAVQYSDGAANFLGNANFSWDNTNRTLTVTTAGATVGMNVVNGFYKSDQGFQANSGTCSGFQCVQTSSGGVYAKSLRALNYTQIGNSTGAPPTTSGDSVQPGQMYWENGSGGSLKVWNGGSYSTVALGGIQSLNGLTGTPSVTCNPAAGNCTISVIGSNIQISEPQPLGTSSNVTFGSVTTQAGGVIQSGATGASIAFQTTNTNFQVNGNGVLSVVGLLNSTGASGGVNVTGQTAVNSIQTVGGFNAGSTGGGNGVYQVAGSTVINSSGQFVGAAVLATGNVQSGGVFSIAGGFFGQTITVTAGTCQLFFRGGILYATGGTC